MNRKIKTLNILADYFIEKGKVLTLREYRDCDDVPIRVQAVLARFRQWAKVVRMIEVNLPEKFALITSEEVDVKKLEEAEKAAQNAEKLAEEAAKEEAAEAARAKAAEIAQKIADDAAAAKEKAKDEEK